MIRMPFGKNYVQVRLGQNLYTYYCPEARVGDVVMLPPNIIKVRPFPGKVEKLGRGYFGKVKTCHLRGWTV